jgi:hypothetical protein
MQTLCSIGLLSLLSPLSYAAESPPDVLAKHAASMRVPEGFTVVVEPPFVVIGDQPPAAVRRSAEGTVRWTVTGLKSSYFAKDPAEVWEIWLFKDENSYRHHAKTLFNDKPDTPYGYATTEHNALVMNIGTGGGTLVHEIAHPFMDANFPNAPSWFNEGLASLYEQSATRDGKMVGLTNWRLAGLQEAVSAGAVPTFHTLTHTTTNQFYNADPGTNYSQARYLMYWLQENDKLRQYYREFAANQATDPSGFETLKRVVGTDDMTSFQREWEAWVTTLRFPEN